VLLVKPTDFAPGVVSWVGAAAAAAVVLSIAAAPGTAKTARLGGGARTPSNPSVTTAPADRWRTGPRTWGGTAIRSLDPAPIAETPALAAAPESLPPPAATSGGRWAAMPKVR